MRGTALTREKRRDGRHKVWGKDFFIIRRAHQFSIDSFQSLVVQQWVRGEFAWHPLDPQFTCSLTAGHSDASFRTPDDPAENPTSLATEVVSQFVPAVSSGIDRQATGQVSIWK